MSPGELNAYLYAKIPLAAFMQVRVASVSPEQVELTAPLEPNVNVHGTLFGGSAASLALLAAWALAHLRAEAAALRAPLVVRSHHMTYSRPVTDGVKVVASFAKLGDWQAFVEQVGSRGRGRINVSVAVESAGELCAQLSAEFAVSRGA